MTTQTISTLEDALAFLAAYENTPADATPAVNFAGEMAELEIEVEGPRYDATVPAELARGLWEYQEAFYKAVAFALYGVEDIRKLTWEQRGAFELVFAVSKGSTDLKAPLKDIFAKLGEGFLTMESKHKALVLVVVAVLVAGGYSAVSVNESQSKVKQEEIKAQTSIALESERTKQFKVMANLVRSSPVAQNFAKAGEEGARAITRRAPDAESIGIGRTRVTRDDIVEVNRRAQMERATAEIVEEDVRVFGTYAKDASSTKYTLARKDGSEFGVMVSHDDMPAADLEKIWAAARDRKPIALQLNLTLQRGKVINAQVVKVL